MRRVVAVLLVLALLGGGAALVIGEVLSRTGDDTSDGEVGPPPEPQEGSDQAPTRALSRYYGQQLDWSACGDNECARLTVPLDYDKPRGRTIGLALLRVPARGERVGPLVVNPGGPGAPGTTYAEAADRVVGSAVRENLDLVGFDPRGTGDSSPVDCLSDDALDAYLAADPAPDDAAERRTLVEGVRALGQGCVDDDAQLAAHITTVEAARDMDVLRSALGRTSLDYLGKSYGTKLGATYAELFPDRVGRMVLDGAVDVSLPSRELGLEQARGFETALRAYVENCVENVDSCFLGDSVDEGMATIATFLEEVDAEPVPTSSERQLTIGRAFYGIVAPLYVRDYWYALSAGLRSAMNGNGSLLLMLADTYASRAEDGSYTDNSSEAFPAISCLDDPYSVAPSQVPPQVAEFREASPTFGDVFAWGLIGCSGQVARATEPPPDIDAAGAAPIVVVGTTRDPATPYAWSEALAAQLESGVLVTRDGDGHTGYFSGNDCVDEAVEAFWLDGDVPEDGLSC